MDDRRDFILIIGNYKVISVVQNQKMGKNQSQASHQTPDFNLNEWEENTEFTEALGSDIGYFKTYRNKRTQQLVDAYEVFFPSEKDYEEYLDSFEWRLHEQDIVNTKYFEPDIQSQLCSTSYLAKVYIEHPKTRLSDFKDIPCPDNLYCLCAMLEGFGKLFEKIGRFPISEDQVAIDENGKIKVWLNSDFSKNYPSQFQIQFKHQTEEQMEQLMVEEIVKMVALNTDQSSEPEAKFLDFFERQKYNNQHMGFVQTRNLVEEYNAMHRLDMKDFFQSVVEIYNNNQYEEEDEGDQIVSGSLQQQSNQQIQPVPEIQPPPPPSQPQPNHGRYLTNHSSQNNLYHQSVVQSYPIPSLSFQPHIAQSYTSGNVGTFPPPHPKPQQNLYSFNASQSIRPQFSPQPPQPIGQSLLLRPSTQQSFAMTPIHYSLTPPKRPTFQEGENRTYFIRNKRQNEPENKIIYREVLHRETSREEAKPFHPLQSNFSKHSPMGQPKVYQQHQFQPVSMVAHQPSSHTNTQREIIQSMRKTISNENREESEEDVEKDKKCYFTVQDEIELDPQIAADLLKYI